ncbi:DUF397 domain-containing protein [Streptomyces sp. NPDC002668]|uniref:DUF397 domain-containing protein n=1 Tax=Streptomyces sp. NPDC002668 TaxID=3154422 RepID=UPI0033336DE0
MEETYVDGSWSWRKASASDSAGNQCVEVAWTGHVVLVRDSSDPRSAVLRFAPTVWNAFLLTSIHAVDPVPLGDSSSLVTAPAAGRLGGLRS